MAGESTENVGPSQIVSVAAVAPDGRQVRLRIDDDGNLRCSLGSETVVVDLATAVHVTNATSAAAVNVTCAAGTFAVEGWCDSSFYYRRAATAVATDTLHPAGRFNIPAVAGTFSILVSSASATRIDAVPMGVA